MLQPNVENADPGLEVLVEEAREMALSPMAFASVVLDLTQFFRAARGLPPTLESSRATAACDALCQFVVRDARPWFVEDVRVSDVPQELAGELGLRAYLAHPVYVRGRIVGSLCVGDAVVRTWTQTIWERLAELAERMTARFNQATNQEDAPSREDRLRDELGSLVRLMRGLSDGPLTIADARVALATLGQSPDVLHVLTRDSTLRDELSSAHDVDLSGLVAELRGAGQS
ncbi:MAG: GAF domain-containing protein [Myxococcota bacterium]